MEGKIQIRFLGASQTVTGSRFLLTVDGKNILIDCGLFQGLKNLRLQNWEEFPVDPRMIDAIVLTHAHIDHSGYIPRLIKQGFSGRVYCTPATMALCRILLPDTGYLQEEEAEFLNRKKLSKHDPALPLFTQEEAEESLRRFVPRGFHEDFEVLPGVKVRFLYAGHILGAAIAVISAHGRTIGFSGDIGRPNDPLLRAPDKLPPLDYLLVESTYGDRQHPETDPMMALEISIKQSAALRGVVLIPAFAVGRAQNILYYIWQLKKAGRIPEIPVYLNSPMAQSVTELLVQFKSLHKLSDAECREMCAVARFIRTPEESRLLNQKRGPMLIISASGMATGGRILHHLKQFAPDSNNSILLAGFQAAGTRGRSLQDGAEEIKIHGQFVPVRAAVQVIENLSAHADAPEILDWLKRSAVRPRKVFVVHGEPEAALALGRRLTDAFGWSCEVPHQDSLYELD